MTTYEFVRALMKLDPTGDMQIMLSVRTSREMESGSNEWYDACGFAESFTIEEVDETHPAFICIEATDA